jgi:alpha-tubulin suppressor-like RCC1 family protein
VLTMSGVSIVSASAGTAHSIFLSDSGLLFGCGLNSRGQVGPLITPTASEAQGAEESADKNSRCDLVFFTSVPYLSVSYPWNRTGCLLTGR